MRLTSACFALCHAASPFGFSEVRRARVLLLALILVASHAVLASVSSAPVFAQSERSPTAGASQQMAPTAPAIQRFEKPGTAINTESICGNDPRKCGTLWQELTFPHDPTYQGRLKAQKAYNECMVRCMAAPQQRQ